jgi:regulation of enolase protein 1 (concanavalin A-like superfamily)
MRWQGTPQNWSLDAGNNLSITAGAKTDWFLDPGGSVNVLNAPALLAKVQQPCMLKALVTSNAASMFDAAVLTVYQSDDQWAKLCFELSPQGQLMIVSVVTKGTSDDCNSIPINGKSVYLRLSVLEKAYAFHYSLDAKMWNMVRYFTLGERSNLEIGFLSQSPTGEACTATFSEIELVPEPLRDIRSGV